MPAKSEATPSEPQVEVVPTEQAVPAPLAAPPVDPPGPPPHPTPAPRRATFKGGPNEYLTPLLVAERHPDGSVTERIFHTPARHLDDDEWQAMAPEQREYIKQAGGRLYDVATDAQVRGEKRTARHDD